MCKHPSMKIIELSVASRDLLSSSLHKEEVKVTLCNSFHPFFFSWIHLNYMRCIWFISAHTPILWEEVTSFACTDKQSDVGWTLEQGEFPRRQERGAVDIQSATYHFTRHHLSFIIRKLWYTLKLLSILPYTWRNFPGFVFKWLPLCFPHQNHLIKIA